MDEETLDPMEDVMTHRRVETTPSPEGARYPQGTSKGGAIAKTCSNDP